MYFSHAFRKTMLGKDNGSAALLATTTLATSALTAGQFGVYDQNFAVLDYTASTYKPFYIVQGSYFTADTIGTHGGYQESVKSKLINPKYISRIFTVAGQTPQQQVVQIPVTCGLTCDTTYRLRIDVKGSPALRFLSHNLYRVLDSYTGCCSTTYPGYVKDPVVTLLNWKDLLNISPYFNNMVQSRVYRYFDSMLTVGANSAAGVVNSNGTTSITFTSPTSNPNVKVGMRVTGNGVPANAFVTTYTSGSTMTITFPTNSTVYSASAIPSSTPLAFWYDLYNANTIGTVSTSVVGTQALIPGTNVVTGGVIGTSSTAAAQVYTPAADAASFSYAIVNGFSTAPFIELTAAYAETKFGQCTFTPTDNYDLEPLKIIASVLDDAGNPCLTYCIGSSTLGEAGIATIVQSAKQANGVGETILREMILTGRYRQEAFPDGSNIDLFRMREIEANPGVTSMLPVTSRNSLYNKLCILHNVPRWNNPTSVFDNDQYLIEIAVPVSVPVTTLIANTGSGSGFGDYIWKAANAMGNTLVVERF